MRIQSNSLSVKDETFDIIFIYYSYKIIHLFKQI